MRLPALCRHAAVLTLVLAAGCGRDNPPPPPPPPPLPSAWTPADSHQAAGELVTEALKHPWIAEFRNHAGHDPQVGLGEITDHSDGQIDIAVFSKELGRALAASGHTPVPPTSSDHADFTMLGSVGEQDGQSDGQPVKFYQLDLRIVDAKGQVVCTLPLEKHKDDRLPPPPAGSDLPSSK